MNSSNFCIWQMNQWQKSRMTSNKSLQWKYRVPQKKLSDIIWRTLLGDLIFGTKWPKEVQSGDPRPQNSTSNLFCDTLIGPIFFLTSFFGQHVRWSRWGQGGLGSLLTTASCSCRSPFNYNHENNASPIVQNMQNYCWPRPVALVGDLPMIMIMMIMLITVIFSSTMILMVLMMMVISTITIMIKTLRWTVNDKKSTLNNEWNWIYHCWQKKTHRVKIEPTTEDHMVDRKSVV